MSDALILVVAVTVTAGSLLMLYAYAKVGVGNYPFDRPSPSPWVDPYEQTTPSVTVGSPGPFPADHRSADPVDLDAIHREIHRPAAGRQTRS